MSHGDTGASLVELLLVLVLMTTLCAAAVPATSAFVDEGRVRQAAAFTAGRLRDAKQQAVMRAASTGLVFDLVNGRWTFRICVDGNANGLRRADVRSGRDTCAASSTDLATFFPGVAISVDAGIRGPDGDAPASDAIRFGASDMASFSPTGSCTGGTLFLRSSKGAQYAVRVAGVTGRLRVLRYDSPGRLWREL